MYGVVMCTRECLVQPSMSCLSSCPNFRVRGSTMNFLLPAPLPDESGGPPSLHPDQAPPHGGEEVGLETEVTVQVGQQQIHERREQE